MDGTGWSDVAAHKRLSRLHRVARFLRRNPHEQRLAPTLSMLEKVITSRARTEPAASAFACDDEAPPGRRPQQPTRDRDQHRYYLFVNHM